MPEEGFRFHHALIRDAAYEGIPKGARADLHERKMMGGVAFMVKGGMCCAVSGRGGMLVRVGPDKA